MVPAEELVLLGSGDGLESHAGASSDMVWRWLCYTGGGAGCARLLQASPQRGYESEDALWAVATLWPSWCNGSIRHVKNSDNDDQ